MKSKRNSRIIHQITFLYQNKLAFFYKNKIIKILKTNRWIKMILKRIKYVKFAKKKLIMSDIDTGFI